MPIFIVLTGRPVILLGDDDATAPKRRLLERAGAHVVGEDDSDARLAIVADDEAAVTRLKARGVLVNAVDRPELCDFTLPAIVDRDPVIVAIGTGGVSAGLAAALRQRMEGLIPTGIGRLAERLYALRGELRARYPDGAERRRAVAGLIGDPLAEVRADTLAGAGGVEAIVLRSDDPDDLTLREARWLAQADLVLHRADVPAAVLDRARADAARAPWDGGAVTPVGLTVTVERG
nr:NAD(P)-dependent oxidoreductase [Sphingomonas jinjuensis]